MTKAHSKWKRVKSALPCIKLSEYNEYNVNIRLRGVKSCFVQARSPLRNVDCFILHTFGCESALIFSVCVILFVVFWRYCSCSKQHFCNRGLMLLMIKYRNCAQPPDTSSQACWRSDLFVV